ncbi:MAG: hypothetical protein HDT42_01030 [Ruminococcaceae bacterium]|nr:hypothetical protein [Oscillospiraceae bacterium]
MGFVQLSDNLTNWEWFDDKNTVYVYLWLLLRAEWRATRYRGMEIERGQVITTYTEISEKCGVTIRQARTILDRLKTTGKATVKTTSKFSIITMLEYDCNVKSDSLSDSQMTDKRQTARQSNDKPTLYNTNIQNTKEQTPRAAREGLEDDVNFEKFWSSYPKKIAKQQALNAWNKINPDEELTAKILASLERQKKSVQWTKDNGQYIPYPVTWLNGKRWEDEPQETNENEKHNRDISKRSKSDWLAGFI